MAHNPLIPGSTPGPATKIKNEMNRIINIETVVEREEETLMNGYALC